MIYDENETFNSQKASIKVIGVGGGGGTIYATQW